jgi:L-alanine-DL-glutamate epimerase-like enolase superfamily enzyme
MPAGGYYYPGKDLSALRGEMRGYLDRGYNVVKMKIGGAPIAEDASASRRCCKEIGSQTPSCRSMPTAASIWRPRSPMPRCCATIQLFWYEEIGDPLDFQLQAAMAEFYPGPMATGENLFSHQDARNLLRYGGMRPDRDWLQFDCALSYGLCEYQRTLEVLQTQGWSPSRCIPHGGHQMSLNIAAGPRPRRQ